MNVSLDGEKDVISFLSIFFLCANNVLTVFCYCVTYFCYSDLYVWHIRVRVSLHTRRLFNFSWRTCGQGCKVTGSALAYLLPHHWAKFPDDRTARMSGSTCFKSLGQSAPRGLIYLWERSDRFWISIL